MSEPLPHDLDVNATLTSYGITDLAEPMMRILGGRTVLAGANARRTLKAAAALLHEIDLDEDSLGAFDTARLEAAIAAVADYHQARRELLATAAHLPIRS